MMQGNRHMKPEDRFWDKVDKTDGCWLWVGNSDRDGYGRFFLGKRRWFAHRVVAMWVGMDIDGKVVMHVCDEPACVRPDHLVVGTQADNLADMRAKGREARGAMLPAARRTHCPSSHEYTPENTYNTSDGRRCRTCSMQRDHIRRARERQSA